MNKNLVLFILIILIVSAFFYLNKKLSSQKVSVKSQASERVQRDVPDCQYGGLIYSSYGGVSEPFKVENIDKWKEINNLTDGITTIVRNDNNAYTKDHPIIHLSCPCNIYFQFQGETDSTITFYVGYSEGTLYNATHTFDKIPDNYDYTLIGIKKDSNNFYYFLRYNPITLKWQVYQDQPADCQRKLTRPSPTPTPIPVIANTTKYNQMFSVFQNICKIRETYPISELLTVTSPPKTIPLTSYTNDSSNKTYVFYTQCSGYNSSFVCWKSKKYQNNVCAELPIKIEDATYQFAPYRCLTADKNKKTLTIASCLNQ